MKNCLIPSSVEVVWYQKLVHQDGHVKKRSVPSIIPGFFSAKGHKNKCRFAVQHFRYKVAFLNHFSLSTIHDLSKKIFKLSYLLKNIRLPLLFENYFDIIEDHSLFFA